MNIKTDVKLYMLTKHLYAIYEKNTAVKETLKTVLGQNDDFWDMWLQRYYDLSYSREIQIMMLREAGYTYRNIQDTVGVSPSTVQHTLNNYELDYGELEGTNELMKPLSALEARLKKAGTPIWK